MPSRFIAYYYWLTPLFWLVDEAFGANLRAAALEGYPFWKAMYYFIGCGCGLLIWKRPAWTKVVGLSEASLNILLLLLGILVPYFRIIEELAAGGAAIETSSLSPARATGLLLAGLVWAASFHLQLATVSRTPHSR